MEDNEFEEVTIISHTDRPQRVFSEKSIEKLKDQVSLQIVQKIEKTERKIVQEPFYDPRLAPGLRELEKLKQDHFGEGEGKILFDSNFYFISRVAGESGQYLLGTHNRLMISNGQKTKIVPTTAIFYILPWNSNFLVIHGHRNFVSVFNQQLTLLNTVPVSTAAAPGRFVHCTPESVYFRTNPGYTITKLDRELVTTKCDSHTNVQDFFVCPKTETITTLAQASGCYFIKRNKLVRKLGSRHTLSCIHILKKMYSDHFLVGESPLGNMQNRLHLWDNKNLVHITSIEVRRVEGSAQNIRLLAPRQGISCFLVQGINSLELFCEYRLKLYHLKTLEIKGTISVAAHQVGALWMVGCGLCILSVRVDFSKCPALQL